MAATLAPLRRGGGDPAHRQEPGGAVWRCSRTPEGPGTLRLAVRGDEVLASAWGPGADWLLDGVPALLGEDDDPSGFEPRHAVVASAWARHAAWRPPRTRLVLESLVPAVLEQRVTGGEARRSWRHLLLRFGEPAPGPAPAGMRVPLSGEGWRHVPSWEWHRAGVDGQRASTVVRAARVAGRLEATAELPGPEAGRVLRLVPGVGVWTAAEVRQRAHGDPDAVSVGDFHLAALVGWALVGGPVDDDGMLELLSCYAGHRYRAVRMVELSGVRKPGFAPRYSPQDLRAL
ncbi:DNA-3-methyladenine glycosylase 2 family protein [Vallicoccus soli]|uniref:DNA-3-methyladenine glycosylase 2 family protein n=1 Tax=Vallicoccus soli TaxID=2339232 RepID=A0A3A3YVB9_9ACTN|nr:DNA-3-methyladenine glycosylase 2 family protein [Vallicoccus soli]